MALRAKSASGEPETLRVHREMYERRLRDMESCDKPQGNDDVEIANSPEVLRHQDLPPGNEEGKAASMRD